jgi:hypothetical protein
LSGVGGAARVWNPYSVFFTHLSLGLPAGATTLPQEMAGLLCVCSKLEDLDMRGSNGALYSRVADITALASGTQLLSLKLPW